MDKGEEEEDATECDVRCVGVAHVRAAGLVGLFETLVRWRSARVVLVHMGEADLPLLCPLYAHRVRLLQEEDGTARVVAWCAVYPSFCDTLLCGLDDGDAVRLVDFVARCTHFVAQHEALQRGARARRNAGIVTSTLHAALLGTRPQDWPPSFIGARFPVPLYETVQAAAAGILASGKRAALGVGVARGPATVDAVSRPNDSLARLWRVAADRLKANLPPLVLYAALDVPALFALGAQRRDGADRMSLSVAIRGLLPRPGRAAGYARLLRLADAGLDEWLGAAAEVEVDEGATADLLAFCQQLSREQQDHRATLWHLLKGALDAEGLGALFGAATHVVSTYQRRLRTCSVTPAARITWAEVARQTRFDYAAGADHGLGDERTRNLKERALLHKLLGASLPREHHVDTEGLLAPLVAPAAGAASAAEWRRHLHAHMADMDVRVVSLPVGDVLEGVRVVRLPEGDVSEHDKLVFDDEGARGRAGYAGEAAPLLARYPHTAAVIFPSHAVDARDGRASAETTLGSDEVCVLARSCHAGGLPAWAARLTHVCLLEAHAYTVRQLVQLLDAVQAVRAANSLAAARALGLEALPETPQTTTILVGCAALAGPFVAGTPAVSALRTLLGDGRTGGPPPELCGEPSPALHGQLARCLLAMHERGALVARAVEKDSATLADGPRTRVLPECHYVGDAELRTWTDGLIGRPYTLSPLQQPGRLYVLAQAHMRWLARDELLQLLYTVRRTERSGGRLLVLNKQGTMVVADLVGHLAEARTPPTHLWQLLPPDS